MKIYNLLPATILIPVILSSVACKRAPIRDNKAITREIQATLYLDPTLRARDISVIAQNGVVTLSGQVNSGDERTSAQHVASATAGVKQVIDQLVVVGPSPAVKPADQQPVAPKEPKQAGDP